MTTLEPEGRSLTILQGSDLHFGEPHLPRVAAAFHDAVCRAKPDAIVLAGDFTQRAKVREFREARAFIDTLPSVPMIVTPGNHDIPLYRVWERLSSPFRNYREYISPELDGTTRVDAAVFVTLCSAEPRRAISNGRLRDEQVEFAARIFQQCSAEDLRILVTHHPLLSPPDGGSDRILPHSAALLERFREMGVELILSGHLHRGYVVTSRREGSMGSVPDDLIGEGQGRVIHVHSGTAMSNRGRMAEKVRNSLNVLEIDDREIVVTAHWYEEEVDGFVPRRSISFPRVP